MEFRNQPPVFTRRTAAEFVSDGHPDKLCDQFGDAILDACLEQDPDSRVAVEAACKGHDVFLLGEITSRAEVDLAACVRRVLDGSATATAAGAWTRARCASTGASRSSRRRSPPRSPAGVTSAPATRASCGGSPATKTRNGCRPSGRSPARCCSACATCGALPRARHSGRTPSRSWSWGTTMTTPSACRRS